MFTYLPTLQPQQPFPPPHAGILFKGCVDSDSIQGLEDLWVDFHASLTCDESRVGNAGYDAWNAVFRVKRAVEGLKEEVVGNRIHDKLAHELGTLCF